MQLSSQQILGLPVETKSGFRLGVVSFFEIDADQQTITRYTVRPALVPRVLARELIIGAAQVISLTNKKIIVEDGLAPSRAAEVSPVVN